MQKISYLFLSLFTLIFVSACSEIELGSHVAKTMATGHDVAEAKGDFKVGSPYKIKGRLYYPKEQYHHSETGVASWYGPGFHGKLTANGEVFNKYEYTAAHRTLQLPSIIRVTNLNNGRSLILRVNDRGPFAHDRILDVSEKAAETLGFKHAGTTRIRIDVLEDESRIVASAAKRGISTRGTEIALNRRQSIGDLRADMPTPSLKPYTKTNVVRMASFTPSIEQTKSSFENTVLHKVISKPSIVETNQDIFVQAGAFANEDNALTLKTALYNVSEPVNVYRNVEGSGEILYRVKIGPVATVEKADKILNMLNKQGRNAKLVVANR